MRRADPAGAGERGERLGDEARETAMPAEELARAIERGRAPRAGPEHHGEELRVGERGRTVREQSLARALGCGPIGDALTTGTIRGLAEHSAQSRRRARRRESAGGMSNPSTRAPAFCAYDC
jgi:hypothetical protein